MFNSNCIRTVGLALFLGLTTVPVNAFTVNFGNPDFENGYTNWNTTGDASIQQGFQGIGATRGSNQALITTSCPNTAFASGECFDTQNPSMFRQDDPSSNNGRTFNFSGLDQTDANGNNSPNNLQSFLGLGSNALNIERTGGNIPGFRTPKEGAAITQTITVDEPFILSFDWNYLTNDGTDEIFGNQDYSFLTFYPQDSAQSDRTVEILGDSTGIINTPIPNAQTDFEKIGGYMSYDSGFVEAGTYVIGLGVVDVDGTGISSGLLLDNFAIREVPFDFSATTSLAFVAGIFGLVGLRRKFKQAAD